jgi:phospholipase C
MAAKKTTLIGIGVMVLGVVVAGVGLRGVVVGPTKPVPRAAPVQSPATPTAAPGAEPSPSATASASGRAYDHVVVVVLENHSFESVSGNSQAPYLNSLAAQNALATGYSGVSHPSLPNYLALTGGSTFGITSDCTGCFVGAPSVADPVEAAGLTWRAYNESMPSACFGGDAYPYAQKHDPFFYYNSIRQNPSRCANIVPLTSLDSDFASAGTTPAFSLVTPNMCNDGHDCSLVTTDGWLARFVPSLMSSPGFASGRSLLVVTYDEGVGGSDRVVTVFAGSGIKAGFTSARQYNHYSLLRTVEDSLGLATLGQADQSATSMKEFFTAG